MLSLWRETIQSITAARQGILPKINVVSFASASFACPKGADTSQLKKAIPCNSRSPLRVKPDVP